MAMFSEGGDFIGFSKLLKINLNSGQNEGNLK